MWSSALVGNKSADVFVPAHGRPRFGLLFLHNEAGETPRDRSIWTQLLAQTGFGCLCPHGGPCWWADRLSSVFDPARTPERHILDHVHRWLQQEWRLTPGRIALAGVGMGGQGALRLAFKHPHHFPVVAALRAAVDQHEAYGYGTPLDELYASREHCRQDSATLHIDPVKQPPHIWFAAHPEDFWFRGNDRLHEKLTALGVAHTFVPEANGAAGSWDYFDSMAGALVAFVVQALEQESRRLL